MARFDTVASILLDVGAELGLGTVTALYPSTDALVTQLQALVKSTGRGLVQQYPWLQNLVSYTFSTTTATVYTLPADFQRMEDGTGWNRDSRQPLVPVSPQQWESFKSLAITVGMPVLFRPRFGFIDGVAGAAPQLEFLSAPTSGQTVALEYRSSYWVANDSLSLADHEVPTIETDEVRLDAQLFSRALKLAWLRAKGFDSSAAQQDFEDALEAVRSAAVVTAPSLSLNGPRLVVDRLLGGSNIPETGYGA